MTTPTVVVGVSEVVLPGRVSERVPIDSGDPTNKTKEINTILCVWYCKGQNW